MNNYVEGMTLEQTEAINGESPLIIVRAGAGTGKTRVLINRARRLNSLGRNVLMTTFTRASRKEIEERLASFTEDEFSGGTSVHTLNALAWRLAGCPVLTSYNEKLRLMKNLVEKHKNIYALSPHIDENEGKVDEQEVFATEWLRMVDRLHANDVFGYHEEIENEEIRNLLVEWDNICETNKIIDETTIFKYARLNVEIDPTTRIWDDILIDESQDLSLIQYNFIIQLASNKKLFMVGDPDQSIYAFRAAIPGFMTDMFEYGGFKRDDIQFLSLTLNYRCTNQILKPAINCINSIEYRSSPKVLIAQKDGDPLRVIKSVNEKTEAKYIVDRIEALISAGIPYEEIAILSRRHRSLNATISELAKRHIPYIQMGSAFMEREEVKNIQALINLLINPDDISAAQKVLNVFYKKKEQMPEIFESGSAYAEMIRLVGNKGKNKDITHKLDALNQMVDERIPCEVILNRIYSWFELKDKWQNKKEYRFLFHSLNDLLDMAKNCSTLQELAMALEIRRFEMEGASKSENAIFVGTIFSSKGLEFQHIFIPGVFLGAFPSMHAMDIEESTVDQRYNPLFSGDIDEEKRLLYVGITRAMKSCTITWPTKTGNGSYAKPKMMSPLLYSLKVNLPR